MGTSFAGGHDRQTAGHRCESWWAGNLLLRLLVCWFPLVTCSRCFGASGWSMGGVHCFGTVFVWNGDSVQTVRDGTVRAE